MAAPVIGKVNRGLFERVIFPNLGAEDASVIVGPQFGVDFGVVRVGDYDLIFEVDPVYVVPEYGWEKSAWFASTYWPATWLSQGSRRGTSSLT
jgi:Hydrogenase maturation factor